MPICLSHQSAFELFRIAAENPSWEFSHPLTGRLHGCSMSAACERLDALGLAESLSKPVHLLVPRGKGGRAREGFVRHFLAETLPPRTIWNVSGEVNVVSPALCVVQIASVVPEVDAALAAFELCGTYCLVEKQDGSRGLVTRGFPLLSGQRLERLVLRLAGTHGTKIARSILAYLLDGSESPMETAMAMMLTAPTRIGGMGFKGAVLNREIKTADGTKRIDLLWPEYNLGLEYQGVEAHEGWSRRIRDDRRRNAITAKGVTILPVYFQDLATSHLFDMLVGDIARIARIRIRISMRNFRYRQMLLRYKVLPPVGLRE